MAQQVDWTYELPPIGTDPEGIEDYVIETDDGERIGTVAAVLRRDADVYLAFGAAAAPMARMRAVPWDTVSAVDPSEAAVRLSVSADEMEERALALDPSKKVEGGPADAVRVVSAPAGMPAYASPDELGPSERPLFWAALGAMALGLFCLLALFVFVPDMGTAGLAGLAAGAGVLIGVAVLLISRVYKAPYARRRRPTAR